MIVRKLVSNLISTNVKNIRVSTFAIRVELLIQDPGLNLMDVHLRQAKGFYHFYFCLMQYSTTLLLELIIQE